MTRSRRGRCRAHRRGRRADRRGAPCATSTASSHAAHASSAPTLAARAVAARRGGTTRCSAVVNEVAKKIVSTRPSTPVAFRTSSDDAKASWAVVSASPRMPSRTVTVVMIDERMRVGHERGDDDHEREERDERLPGERDAAIDELDLEHALPHAPEEQSLQPSPQCGTRSCTSVLPVRTSVASLGQIGRYLAGAARSARSDSGVTVDAPGF